MAEQNIGVFEKLPTVGTKIQLRAPGGGEKDPWWAEVTSAAGGEFSLKDADDFEFPVLLTEWNEKWAPGVVEIKYPDGAEATVPEPGPADADADADAEDAPAEPEPFDPEPPAAAAEPEKSPPSLSDDELRQVIRAAVIDTALKFLKPCVDVVVAKTMVDLGVSTDVATPSAPEPEPTPVPEPAAPTPEPAVADEGEPDEAGVDGDPAGGSPAAPEAMPFEDAVALEYKLPMSEVPGVSGPIAKRMALAGIVTLKNFAEAIDEADGSGIPWHTPIKFLTEPKADKIEDAVSAHWDEFRKRHGRA